MVLERTLWRRRKPNSEKHVSARYVQGARRQAVEILIILSSQRITSVYHVFNNKKKKEVSIGGRKEHEIKRRKEETHIDYRTTKIEYSNHIL